MMPISGDLIAFVLVCWGITNILVNSKLFKPLRDRLKPVPFLGQMIYCTMCMGWWVGLAVSCLGMNITEVSYDYRLEFIADAFVSSGTCWIIYVALARMGSMEL